jgi:hypothetical protein
MPTHLIVELVELHTRCKARETSNEIQIHRRAAGLTFHATEYNVSSITEQYVVISSTTTELHHIYIYAAAPTVWASWIIFLVPQESRQLPCNASLPIVLTSFSNCTVS